MRKTKVKTVVRAKQAQSYLNKQQVNTLMNSHDAAYDSDSDNTTVLDFDKEIKNPNDLQGVDLVFVLDTTGSMNAYIKGAQKVIRKIMIDAEKFVSNFAKSDDIVKFGLVEYRDHPPQCTSFVTRVHQLCDRPSIKKLMLSGIECQGGGDTAEAVLDGLNDAVNKISWREESEKFIIHILDSPPHGEEFGSDKDTFKTGCPCNLSSEDILVEMREKEIDYNIIKLSPSIEKMINIFTETYKFDVIDPTIKPDEKANVSQD